MTNRTGVFASSRRSLAALRRNPSIMRSQAAAILVKQTMVDRFERAKAEGDLPAHIDIEGLTRVLIAFLQGISIQANMDATRDDLDRLVDTALALWPSA